MCRIKYFVESSQPVEGAPLIEDSFGWIWKRFHSPRGISETIFCEKCGDTPFWGWQQVGRGVRTVWCDECVRGKDDD
jgi:hypothetical protein